MEKFTKGSYLQQQMLKNAGFSFLYDALNWRFPEHTHAVLLEKNLSPYFVSPQKKACYIISSRKKKNHLIHLLLKVREVIVYLRDKGAYYCGNEKRHAASCTTVIVMGCRADTPGRASMQGYAEPSSD